MVGCLRDTWVTERLDYCSANLVIGCGLCCALARALGESQPRRAAAAVAVVVAAVGWHLRYLLVVKFDYGWNMKFCIALGLINAVRGRWKGVWTFCFIIVLPL